MAEPRKVPFVTISSYNNSPTTQDLTKKRRREDEAINISFGTEQAGSGSLFGNSKGADAEMDKSKSTVRLILPLSEPNELASSEFNYRDLVHSTLVQVENKGQPGGHDNFLGSTGINFNVLFTWVFFFFFNWYNGQERFAFPGPLWHCTDYKVNSRWDLEHRQFFLLSVTCIWNNCITKHNLICLLIFKICWVRVVSSA